MAICTWPKLYIQFAVRQQIYVGVSIYLWNLSTGQTDRQTHGRGYMYLAQAEHILRCKAVDLCWHLYLRNLSTDRQTDTRTWLYVPGPGGTYIVYCKAVDLCWRLYLRNLCTDRQTDTDRQTHGRGYMYLARTVHIVYCKAADLC